MRILGEHVKLYGETNRANIKLQTVAVEIYNSMEILFQYYVHI